MIASQLPSSRRAIAPLMQHALRGRSHLRPLSSSAAVKVNTHSHTASGDASTDDVGLSRLEGLRLRLDHERSSLHEFSEVSSAAGCGVSSSALEPAIVRRKAPPKSNNILPKPRWLKAAPATSEKYHELRTTVRSLGLATVCEEAKCPNIGDCWGGGNGGKSNGDSSLDEHHGTATALAYRREAE